MSLQKVWNNKKRRVDWIDLSYILGKKDKPDPRHGKPYKKVELKNE